MLDQEQEIRLRPAAEADVDFLRAVFASTRTDELAALASAHQQAFLELQFTAQRAQYRFAYPNADSMIVLLNNRPIGRLMVNRGDEVITLVDIALLTEHRGAGIGTFLLKGLLEEAAAAGKSVRLHALMSSPTLKLYERLGFATAGDDGTYLEMLWVPRSGSASQ